MKLEPKGKQIADYVWLDETQRSWHLWTGNPFCVGLMIINKKKFSLKKVIDIATKQNAIEKKRFKKLFPDVEWVCKSPIN